MGAMDCVDSCGWLQRLQVRVLFAIMDSIGKDNLNEFDLDEAFAVSTRLMAGGIGLPEPSAI